MHAGPGFRLSHEKSAFFLLGAAAPGLSSAALQVIVKMASETDPGVADYGEDRWYYPVFERQVLVHVSPAYGYKKFLTTYGQGISPPFFGTGILARVTPASSVGCIHQRQSAGFLEPAV